MVTLSAAHLIAVVENKVKAAWRPPLQMQGATRSTSSHVAALHGMAVPTTRASAQ